MWDEDVEGVVWIRGGKERGGGSREERGRTTQPRFIGVLTHTWSVGYAS